MFIKQHSTTVLAICVGATYRHCLFLDCSWTLEMSRMPCDWQNDKYKLAERGRYLLEHPHWSDCSFLVGSEPNQKADFQLPQTISGHLQYIYTDNINLQSFDQACELCYAAKKYMLPHVVEECTKYLWSDLYPRNVCRAYEFAKLFEESQLEERCLEIMQEKTNEVIQENNFEDIAVTTLDMLLQQDNLKVSSELDLIDASLRWARKEAERKALSTDGAGLREALASALSHLRFLTLTPAQFADGPALSEVLSRDESFAILLNISSPGRVPLPEGLSTRTDRRRSPNPDPPQSFIFSDHAGVRDNRKCFCQRSLLEEIPCYNACNLDCSVTFSVDRNICVLGIQLPTQINRPSLNNETSSNFDMFGGPSVRPSAPVPFFQLNSSTYNELIYAHLLDSENSRLTYTHFTGRVRFETLIDINFNRPVFIQKNKEYRIWVVLNKLGTYPGGTCAEQMSCANVGFRFRAGESGNPERDSIIRSIIFTRA
ncbi:hypothetical protein B566_EDAN004334 [Ephemera danica]|nr:hypothetical protein B566_EDAN004334 [Ephemera danica]